MCVCAAVPHVQHPTADVAVRHPPGSLPNSGTNHRHHLIVLQATDTVYSSSAWILYSHHRQRLRVAEDSAQFGHGGGCSSIATGWTFGQTPRQRCDETQEARFRCCGSSNSHTKAPSSLRGSPLLTGCVMGRWDFLNQFMPLPLFPPSPPSSPSPLPPCGDDVINVIAACIKVGCTLSGASKRRPWEERAWFVWCSCISDDMYVQSMRFWPSFFSKEYS